MSTRQPKPHSAHNPSRTLTQPLQGRQSSHTPRLQRKGVSDASRPSARTAANFCIPPVVAASCGDEDVLSETAGSAPHGSRLPPSGRRVPDPCFRTERRHRARRPPHERRGIGLPWKGTFLPSAELCNRADTSGKMYLTGGTLRHAITQNRSMGAAAGQNPESRSGWIEFGINVSE